MFEAGSNQGPHIVFCVLSFSPHLFLFSSWHCFVEANGELSVEMLNCLDLSHYFYAVWYSLPLGPFVFSET